MSAAPGPRPLHGTLVSRPAAIKASAGQFVNCALPTVRGSGRRPHMLELVLILAFLAATAWIGARAFRSPKSVYLRSLIGLLLCVLAAAAVWWLASPLIANEAGLGAFVLFCIIVALG